MQIDTSGWSGEGSFTHVVVDVLKAMGDGIAFLRVEDAPATRSDVDYNFVSNEVFVGFCLRTRRERVRRFGVLPLNRTIAEKTMTLPDLETALATAPEVGPPDYADETMMQYLRTERIVPPYQTRGYKLVELLRIYEVDPDGRRR